MNVPQGRMPQGVSGTIGASRSQLASNLSARIVERWSARRCVALHAIVTGLILLVYVIGAPEVTLLFGGLLVAPCFFFFVWLEAQKSLLKITPLSMYFVWQGFALGPASIYISTQLLTEPIYFGFHVLSPLFIEKGYIIGLVGTLPLHAGLQWMRPKEAADQVVDPSTREVREVLPFLLIFFCLGCGVLLFSRYFSFLGVINGFFQFAGHGALLSFILIPKDRLGMSEFVRVTVLLVGTAILLAASTRASSKMYLMLALVGLLFYVLQTPTLRRHVPMMAGFLIFIYLTAVAPTVNQARRIEGRDKIPHTQAMIEAFRTYSPLYTGRFDQEFYQEQMETLFSRQFEASSIAVIAEEVERKGYIKGETFYQIRYFLIPRLLWPDKPMMVRGGWFTSYLGSSPRETDSTTSIGMEAAGELYWNFGYPGVVLGMFVLGAMFGGIWRMSGTNPVMQPLHMSLYMLNTLTMMNLPEAASRMVSCIYIFIFFGLLFSLMRPMGRSKVMVFSRA